MYTNADTSAEIFLTQGYVIINKAKIARFECNWTKRTLGCRIDLKENMEHKDLTAVIR